MAKKTLFKKGQAYIIYKDLESAKLAVKSLHNKPLFNKAMVFICVYLQGVQFSKNVSDLTLQMQDKDIEEIKKKRALEKGTHTQKPIFIDDKIKEKKLRRSKKSDRPSTFPIQNTNIKWLVVKMAEQTVLNRILFVQNLPADITVAKLTELFQQYENPLIN